MRTVCRHTYSWLTDGGWGTTRRSTALWFEKSARGHIGWRSGRLRCWRLRAFRAVVLGGPGHSAIHAGDGGLAESPGVVLGKRADVFVPQVIDSDRLGWHEGKKAGHLGAEGSAVRGVVDR